MTSQDPPVHAAQLPGIGREGVTPAVRKQVVSWTEIMDSLTIIP